MKDPKKQTPEQKARKERRKVRYVKEMAKNALTFKKRGRYARRAWKRK